MEKVGALSKRTSVGNRQGDQNHQRTRNDMEYELLDTGVFRNDRYFDVFVEYGKASAEGILVKISTVNRGPEASELHLLPTLWFRIHCEA